MRHICESFLHLRGKVRDFIGVAILVVHAHLLRVEIVHKQIVQFLGHLEDTSEDVHFRAEGNDGCVATTGVVRQRFSDLNPLLGGQRELPEVPKLIILVILASEDKDGITMRNCRVRVAGDRACLRRSLIITHCGPHDGVVNIDLGRVYTVNSGTMRAESTEYDKLFIR